MIRKYEIGLIKYEGEISIIKYADNDGHFISSVPTDGEDYAVIEDLKGLMRKLYLTELNATIEIKND